MRKFSLSLLANAVNSGYDQGERCLSAVFFALLTCWHVQFSKIFAFYLYAKLVLGEIPEIKNSDKAASFSSVVANVAWSVQEDSYSKPLHNKSRCLQNTMKSFLTFKVINTWIFLYYQEVLTMKLWQNTQFTRAIFFCFIHVFTV